MTQEELLGLIGLLGGVGGSYFLGDRQAKKEKKEKKEDRLADYEFEKMKREEDREYQKKLKAEEKAERIKEDEETYSIGDLFDPIFDGVKKDSVSNFMNDMSPTDMALAASLAIPGLGMAGLAGRAGLGALRAGRAAKGSGLTGLGASMMDSLSDYFKTPTGTAGAGTGAPFTLPFFNDGGRVNYNMGTGPQGVSQMMAPLLPNIQVNDDPLTIKLFGEMMGEQMSDNDEGIPLSLLESMVEEQEMAKRDRLRELMQYFRD